MDGIEAAQTAEAEARKARRAIEAERDDAIAASRRQIEADYFERIQRASEVVQAARLARVAVEDGSPDHPWTGKRVFTKRNVGSGYAPRYERIEGIVETMRSNTAMPANTAEYRKPPIGEPIVRMLKKDGSPGSKFEKMTRFDKWALVEETPSPTAKVIET